MVTDYDSWHPDHGAVDITAIMRVMQDNTKKAQGLITRLAPMLRDRPALCPYGCDRALEYAIVTDQAKRDPQLVARLQTIARRVLEKHDAN